MLHYTYRIDNLINGKYYIGKHSSDSLDDGYMGSGTLIKAAIAKYGAENFKKTILETFPTSEEAFEHEAQIVTMAEVNDPMCYNIQPGGKGGKGRQKRFTDEERKERLSEQQRKYQREYYQRPEVKEHQREYRREYRQRRPEIKEWIREYNQRPEVKEHQREYMKEYRRKKREQKKKNEANENNIIFL